MHSFHADSSLRVADFQTGAGGNIQGVIGHLLVGGQSRIQKVSIEMDLFGGTGAGEDFAINLHAGRSHRVNHMHLGFVPSTHQDVAFYVIQADARLTRGIKSLLDPSFARGPH